MPAGYARGNIDDGYTGLWKLLTPPKDRTSNQYHEELGEVTNEYIHPSVHYRQYANQLLREDIYEPAALRAWVRVLEENGVGRDGKPKRGWMWIKYVDNDVKKGIENSLWEFAIGGMQKEKSLEKRLIDHSWVDAIHKEVEVSWNEGRT